jgi:hypothetical protein
VTSAAPFGRSLLLLFEVRNSCEPVVDACCCSCCCFCCFCCCFCSCAATSEGISRRKSYNNNKHCLNNNHTSVKQQPTLDAITTTTTTTTTTNRPKRGTFLWIGIPTGAHDLDIGRERMMRGHWRAQTLDDFAGELQRLHLLERLFAHQTLVHHHRKRVHVGRSRIFLALFNTTSMLNNRQVSLRAHSHTHLQHFWRHECWRADSRHNDAGR